MGVLRKVGNSIIRKLTNLYLGNSLAQQSQQAEGAAPTKVDAADAIRRSAQEGIVLLKNDGVLPLAPADKVALFGRTQLDWFYMGYGSGGDVNAPYTVDLQQAAQGRINLHEGLMQRYRKWCASYANSADKGFWSTWPRSNPEMPISDADVAAIAAQCGVAVVCFGRATGEDRDNVLEAGGYYLTKTELTLLDRVIKHFQKTVVVLDIGSSIDMSWVKTHTIDALLIAYFGGQESCNALVDILTGAVSPSGKLPVTIPARYEDYPSATHFGGKYANDYVEDIFVGYRYFETFCPHKVLYPFGFGLSYTKFDFLVQSATFYGDKLRVEVAVTNIGRCIGREVVQLYAAPPRGQLPKSNRVLVAFAKTRPLQVGETQTVTLQCTEYDFANYDDAGYTGYRNAYVLEGGRYRFFVGNNVRCQLAVTSRVYDRTKLVRQLDEVCALPKPFARMATEESGAQPVLQSIPNTQVDLRQRILADLPAPLAPRAAQPAMWQDVVDGRVSLDDFVAQLGLDDLEALSRGHGFINSPLGAAGNGGAMGGITPSLQAKGVPAIIVCDGPSGVRLRAYCNLFPSCVALAAGWDTQGVVEAGRLLGAEAKAHGIHVLLAPGINLHRNPLCGRNFEYVGEDPMLGGKIGAAYTQGVQDNGIAACIKHFACNHQEYMRNRNDSRLSQRALREIYCKSFEIAIATTMPWTLMTAYNKVNGVWCHYNYELATTMLRNEWGYDGLVMTDWWMQHDDSPEFAPIRDNAYRVRAGVDVYMPGSFSRVENVYRSDGSLLSSLGKPEGITLGELQRSARRTLQLALRLHL